MLKNLLLAGLLLTTAGVLSTPAQAQEASAYELQLLTEVNVDSLLLTVERLTGLEPVIVGGVIDTIDSRCDPSEGNELTADWLAQELTRFGLEVEEQPFTYSGNTGRNIIGFLPGASPLQPYVMICAHYDAVEGAPGADDNASGVAAVLEAARILSEDEFDAGILFALWDGEEWGLHGSAEYALESVIREYDYEGIVNLDMIAWDGDGDTIYEIHSNVSTLTILFLSLPGELSLPLVPVQAPNPTTRSDHASFWNYDYPATLIIEEILTAPPEEWNPNYHRETDVIDSLHVPFFHDMAKLATVAVARMASPSEILAIGREYPGISARGLEVFPNPSSDQVTVQFSPGLQHGERLEIIDVWGRTVRQRVPAPGVLNERFDISDLAPGVYHVRLPLQSDVVLSSSLVVQ